MSELSAQMPTWTLVGTCLGVPEVHLLGPGRRGVVPFALAVVVGFWAADRDGLRSTLAQRIAGRARAGGGLTPPVR